MPTLEQIRQVSDFTALYRWQVIFTAFPAAVANPPASEDLDIRLESVELPKRTVTSVEIRIRGHKVKVPGLSEPLGVITFTFVETVDNKVHEFMRAWREAIWQTNTGIQQATEDCKAEILIQRLNNRNEPIWEYKLKGVYLEDYEAGGTLDGATGEPLKPIFTLSYDDFDDRAL